MKYALPVFALSLLMPVGAAMAVDSVKASGSRVMDHSKMEHGQHGQMADTKAGDVFSGLDANKDGKLSRSEMAKHPKASHFSMLDTDKDGSLSPAEYAKAKGM